MLRGVLGGMPRIRRSPTTSPGPARQRTCLRTTRVPTRPRDGDRGCRQASRPPKTDRHTILEPIAPVDAPAATHHSGRNSLRVPARGPWGIHPQRTLDRSPRRAHDYRTPASRAPCSLRPGFAAAADAHRAARAAALTKSMVVPGATANSGSGNIGLPISISQVPSLRKQALPPA